MSLHPICLVLALRVDGTEVPVTDNVDEHVLDRAADDVILAAGLPLPDVACMHDVTCDRRSDKRRASYALSLFASLAVKSMDPVEISKWTWTTYIKKNCKSCKASFGWMQFTRPAAEGWWCFSEMDLVARARGLAACPKSSTP
jgi:hypothetical protein